MKFKKKMLTRIKEFREEKNLPQQELAKLVGVTRQTIYYLEKGSYNPSLTTSFKISEILNKPLNEIFYQEPVIKDLIDELPLKEVKGIAEEIGIPYEKLASLSEIDDEQLTEAFNIALLIKISKALGGEFEDFFEKEATDV